MAMPSEASKAASNNQVQPAGLAAGLSTTAVSRANQNAAAAPPINNNSAVTEAIADGPGWRLRFVEIATREAADGLRGTYLESIVRADDDLARGE